MRRTSRLALLGVCLALSACGGSTRIIREPAANVHGKTPKGGQQLGFPSLATKNTTRVSGADPIADAAGVALAVYPSAAVGTHPAAVTLAPTDDWAAAIASAVLMAPPIRAPILLSGSSALPSATADALGALAPTGSGALNGVQVIRVGDVPKPAGERTTAVAGNDPYTLAAAIDRFASASAGTASSDVVITSATNAPYAMPAAGWAAESGDPVLFVSDSGVPQATRQALQAHSNPNIYVLGPPNVISNKILAQLRKYGKVKRVGAPDPAASSVTFAVYRDPPCRFRQPCAHVPGSFGWAMRSPGHGYVLLDAGRPLDAAASAPLSASGSYGPQLLIDNPSAMPTSVLKFFLDYATPGFTQEGPTAAVYNHGWVIGDQAVISVGVQAQMDNLLEAVPQK